MSEALVKQRTITDDLPCDQKQLDIVRLDQLLRAKDELAEWIEQDTGIDINDGFTEWCCESQWYKDEDESPNWYHGNSVYNMNKTPVKCGKVFAIVCTKVYADQDYSAYVVLLVKNQIAAPPPLEEIDSESE